MKLFSGADAALTRLGCTGEQLLCIDKPKLKKGTEIGSLFAYCCGFFLWKWIFGSLIFLNRPEMRVAALSVSE